MSTPDSTSARAPNDYYCTICPKTFDRINLANVHYNITGHRWTDDPVRAFRAPSLTGDSLQTATP